MSSIRLNDEQAEVFRTLTDGQFTNAIVIALPGTGKTTMSHKIAHTIENTRGCAILTCATTGAATTGMPEIVIGSYRSPARTMHSLVIDKTIPELLRNMAGTLYTITIIIDEIFMCEQKVFGDLVEFTTTLQSDLRQTRGKKPRIQYIFLGDPAQLPAVSCSFLLWVSLERFLNINKFLFLELTIPERFKRCDDMVRIASQIARRDPRFALSLRAFSISSCRPAHPPGCGSIMLSYRRADCESHNNRAFDLARAAGAQCIVLVHKITNEVVMRLASGIRIIMRKNVRDPEASDGGFLYVNGDIGTFETATGTDASSRKLIDEYSSGRIRFLYIDKHLEVSVHLNRRPDVLTTAKPRGVVETIEGKQRKSHALMMNPGEAITIHNSQGMTLDTDITVNLNNLPIREGIGLNLLHVALTRGVSGKGLRIIPWGSFDGGADLDDVQTAQALCDAPVSRGVERFYDIVRRIKRAK